MGYYMFLGFKNQQAVTIILSEADEVENAIDCDRYVLVDDPIHMKTNLEQWLQDRKSEKSNSER